MKNLVIVTRGCAAFGHVFHQNQLVAFQFANLALIGTDDGLAVCIHDAVKKLADFIFHGGLFQLERRAMLLCFLGAAVPQITEHDGGKFDQFTGGRERADKGFERIFYLRARHRLAVAGASMLAAHIVGIATALALGPGRGHGMVAIAAGDETAPREIRVDVLAGRRTGLACQAILNEIEGFKRNQPVMLPFAQRQVPARHFEISGIERLGQDLIDALIGHQPLPVLGK